MTHAEDIEDVYSLSPVQQGLLLHSVSSPAASGHAFVQSSYTLSGPLDSEAFQRAWAELFRRQTVLRTSFHWGGLDEPLQVVHRSAMPIWWEKSFEGLPAACVRGLGPTPGTTGLTTAHAQLEAFQG
jgi:Condensation domain